MATDFFGPEGDPGLLAEIERAVSPDLGCGFSRAAELGADLKIEFVDDEVVAAHNKSCDPCQERITGQQGLN